jgi:hypothetical protein
MAYCQCCVCVCVCVWTVPYDARLRAAGCVWWQCTHQCATRLSWTSRETVGVAVKLTPHMRWCIDYSLSLDSYSTPAPSAPAAVARLVPKATARGAG